MTSRRDILRTAAALPVAVAIPSIADAAPATIQPLFDEWRRTQDVVDAAREVPDDAYMKLLDITDSARMPLSTAPVQNAADLLLKVRVLEWWQDDAVGVDIAHINCPDGLALVRTTTEGIKRLIGGAS